MSICIEEYLRTDDCEDRLMKELMKHLPNKDSLSLAGTCISYFKISLMSGPGFAPGIRSDMYEDFFKENDSEDYKSKIRMISSQIDTFHDEYKRNLVEEEKNKALKTAIIAGVFFSSLVIAGATYLLLNLPK